MTPVEEGMTQSKHSIESSRPTGSETCNIGVKPRCVNKQDNTGPQPLGVGKQEKPNDLMPELKKLKH
jgi:hypothetical protein